MILNGQKNGALFLKTMEEWTNELNEKEKRLWERIEEYTKEDICVAFSGGVDSSLLLVMADMMAKKSGTKVYAITADTLLHPKADLENAKKVLETTACIHCVLKIDELTVPEMKENPKDRCYLCKKELYTKMLHFAKEKKCRWLLDGTNEDDLHVYRPGLRAVRELGVISPLADLGITKREVRSFADKYGISVAHRPSAPCLATRLPYGARLDFALLAEIDAAERKMQAMGYENVRIRVHGEIARIEVDKEQFLRVMGEYEKIVAMLKSERLHYITLDLEGFRSGSMDK